MGSAESPAGGDRRVGRLVDVEVLGQDGPAPRGDRGPGQGVLQLADVARPGPLLDGQEGLGRERELPQPCLRSSAEDVLGQGRDVLGPVAERRDHDPGDVQAVVQVLAEPAGGDLLGQVAVGGRDDAGVGAEGLGPADPLELALLEDAEDLGLGRQRQLADLVEEDRPAGGALEPAGLLPVGAGEAPRSWPNSSLSIRPSGRAPQLTRTNGPAARSEWRCSAEATSSLPVPLSPTIRTGSSVAAARPIALKTSRIAALWPTSSGSSSSPSSDGLARVLAGPGPQRPDLGGQGRAAAVPA